ncbi:oogenesis-related protein sosie isoform X2 [Rhynchophorus ferrugineus]
MFNMKAFLSLLIFSSVVTFCCCVVKAKQCTLQTNCSLIKNTTCLRGACLCGDNHPPNNGECTAQLQGPNHICTKNEDCVDNADCFAIKDLKLTKDLSHLNLTPDLSICRCQEGYTEVGATCGGDINLSTLPVLLLAIALFKVFN